MLEDNHYRLLDKLRFSNSAEERKEVNEKLIELEDNGYFTEKILFGLLDNTDTVFQLHAIRAIGRLKILSLNEKLTLLYESSNNPVLLTALLDTFQDLKSEEFEEVVLKRILKSKWKKKLSKIAGSLFDNIFDEDFILDQILTSSLKYLHIAGTIKAEKVVKSYLYHQDPVVRWNCLAFFDKRKIEISSDDLLQISQKDDNILNRQQAEIMLVKKSKKMGN